MKYSKVSSFNLENLNKLRVSSEVYWKCRAKSLTLFFLVPIILMDRF
jgi:hypothetical protein